MGRTLSGIGRLFLCAGWICLVASKSVGAQPPPHATEPSSETRCPFRLWKTYAETPLYRDEASGAYLFTTRRKGVDADGAPNAYHPDDVGKPCGPTGRGLDCPQNAGYPQSRWWPSILVPDPEDGDVAFRQPTGEFAGFFVSRTTLFDRANPVERDPARYVDARSVPYLVFPRPFFKMRGTGRLGDLGVARNVDSGATIYFVVADIGPAEPLGEGSIALFASLAGRPVSARTGSGVPSGDISYILFPGSGAEANLGWPLDAERLERAGQPLLDALGGAILFESCTRPSP